ncbi:hypothetical protein AM598_10860 [Paenibacillus polymyxa]|nr:hypothetical protein AM598_10860 [Paenibacillus polymyxa]
MDNRTSSNCCSVVPTLIGEKGVASIATIASSSAASKSALIPPLSLKLFARDNKRLKICCKEDTLAAEGLANTIGMIGACEYNWDDRSQFINKLEKLFYISIYSCWLTVFVSF